MRPKSITLLCSIIFLISAVQLVGSMGGILIGNGIGPEKVFKSTEKYEVEERYFVEGELDRPAAPDKALIDSAALERIAAASQYGFVVSFLVLLSVVWLWQMRTKGVYLFAIVYVGNAVTQIILKPEWVMQSQSQTGIWLSLLLPAVYFIVVLPHWKALSIPLGDRPAKPEVEVIGLDVFKIGMGQSRLENQKREKPQD